MESTDRRPIVFLHLPKTAGQSVRTFLINAFPKRSVFPGQTDSHLALYSRSELSRYDIFSGHFSWSLLDFLGSGALVFTILRDPVDRLVSLYSYLRRQGNGMSSSQLAQTQQIGIRKATELMLDEYLSDDDPLTRGFLLSNLDNFYTYYFATRVLLGRQLIRDQYPESDVFITETVMQTAIKNLTDHVKVYGMNNLGSMVSDMAQEKGFRETEFPKINASSNADLNLSSICKNVHDARRQLHIFCQYDMNIYQRFCLSA